MSQDNDQKRAGHALDAANFFLADVRDGLGPYLAIYLLTEQNWNEACIGVVMSIATLAGILAQTPAGALVDATRAKRRLMVGAALLITTASLPLPAWPAFWPVAISQGIAHAGGAVFPPALAAVSLGIFGHDAFTARIGRNETFNHAGNATAAAIAGGAAYLFGPTVVFFLLAVMSLASLASILCIPSRAIDHELARGLHGHAQGDRSESERPAGLAILLTCRPLLVFAICVTLFHLSNAAMLPIRAALYTLSDDPAWLVGVQLLDGIGAGIFGAIFPVIVAELMRNTGRFNVAQGAVSTTQGIGAALSTSLAGVVVVEAGYGAAFLTLGVVALFGALVCLVALPETRAPRNSVLEAPHGCAVDA